MRASACNGIKPKALGRECKMSQDRPWFKSYPENMPHEIDLDEYRSIISVFDTAAGKFKAKPAFLSLIHI